MTPRLTLLAALLILPMSGCTNGSLLAPAAETFTVTSVPSGARVEVMGATVGNTPLMLEWRQVFPRTYPAGQENLYGRVMFTREGCTPITLTVSNKALARGLHAQLVCNDTTPPAVSVTLREKLLELKALHDEGLLNDEEYNRKRQSLIDGF